MISIPVINQQVALEFYRDVLGARVEADVPFDQDGQQRWISMVLPGSLQGIVLATNDVSAAHSELKMRGLRISDIKNQPYGRECTFADPDGNGWVLQQPK